MVVQVLRFADDVAIITESEEDLGNMLKKMNDSCKEYGIKKTRAKLKY